jgi:hypothetical protein
MFVFEVRAGLNGELQVWAHECNIKEITKAFLCSAKRWVLFHVKTLLLLAHCLTKDSPSGVWHETLALLKASALLICRSAWTYRIHLIRVVYCNVNLGNNFCK